MPAQHLIPHVSTFPPCSNFVQHFIHAFPLQTSQGLQYHHHTELIIYYWCVCVCTYPMHEFLQLPVISFVNLLAQYRPLPLLSDSLSLSLSLPIHSSFVFGLLIWVGVIWFQFYGYSCSHHLLVILVARGRLRFLR